MEKVYFKDIKNEIITGIAASQTELRIAVSWFTNEKIFDVLLAKLEHGVKITLVIIDDYINNGDYGLNFQKFIDKGGKLFYGKEENPMHHKFCIIDESILFTGSYNWTYFAEFKNHENVV